MENRFTFSGHQTFTLRHGWIPKAVELIERKADLLNGEDAMLELGIGKNMVDSLRYWLQATKIATKESGIFSLTPLGTLLFGKNGYDRFLEDPATHWLLHWQIATNREKSSTWYWAFSTIKQTDFNEDALPERLQSWIKQNSDIQIPSVDTLKRDIDCCLRSYVTPTRRKDKRDTEDTLDCPLIELELILSLDEIGNKKWYRFNTEAHKQLPDWVLAYAIADYWGCHYKNRETLSFEELAFGDGSPGSVFKMSADVLVDRVERLLEEKIFSFEESNGVRNLVIKDTDFLTDPTTLIKEFAV